jgi:hypothetical protein
VYQLGLGEFGVTKQPSWFVKLSEEYPLIATLAPWNASSYAELFNSGWSVEDSRRYVAPYTTFELMTRAVNGIQKWNEQALSYAEQLPSQYRTSAVKYTRTCLKPMFEAQKKVLGEVIYNTKTRYGIEKKDVVPAPVRYTLYGIFIVSGMWVSPLTWAASWAMETLQKAPDYVTFYGFVVRNIIRSYNICKEWRNACKQSVERKQVQPLVKKIHSELQTGDLIAACKSIANVDVNPAAIEHVEDVLLPVAPTDEMPPTMPDPKGEATEAPVSWWWYAVLGGAGLVGAGAVILLIRQAKK